MATAPTSSDGAKAWKKRSVVSSFLLRGCWTGNIDTSRKPEVTLFERSDKVSTYRKHLAPISGTVETTDPSPLSAALREIREETTLAPPEITLLRQGKPFTFRDSSICREWTVHPFLFGVQPPPASSGAEQPPQPADSKIRIDWEHTRFVWVDPTQAVHDAEAGRIQAVPRLADSLRRVWFEADLGEAAGGVLRAGLHKLATDHESGAAALSEAALKTLSDVVRCLSEHDLHDAGDEREEWKWWWDRIRMAAWHLWKNGRESMGAAILGKVLVVLARMEKAAREAAEDSVPAGAKRKDIWKDLALRAISTPSDEASEPSASVPSAFSDYIIQKFPERIKSREPIAILTLSDSGTVRSCLRHAVDEIKIVLDLRVLESRPLYEGVSLAATLAKHLSSTGDPKFPHKVTLYTDASAALASVNVDVVLLGADRIASSGAVSNKTGSLPAVLAAKHMAPRARVAVVGGTEKIAPPGRPEDHVVEDNGAEQVRRAWGGLHNSDGVRGGAEELQRALSAPSANASAVRTEIPNVFFEWVPPELIDAYVTEAGVWTRERIAEHSVKLGAEVARLLGNL
ncbi:hypothetical protein VTJ83DRAFT_7015 [Remersonia thermophila]|uniref:Nudix hydrolase domain-containing protein n=1 Tax=Remersonia thermophila TaxID=72144 RepID=A0ABR4D2A5_9PEZI